MIILHDSACAEYAAPGHVERPFRVLATAALLRAQRPEWPFVLPSAAADTDLLRAHTSSHLTHVKAPEEDFDEDCPAHSGIDGYARLAVGSAILAMQSAREGKRAFSLMRPPGHHATTDRAMGFCYYNSVAVAALRACADGVGKVAIWDFDAHHGNGTEAILRGRDGFLFASVHQYPAYPGTGGESFENIRNYPIAPGTPPEAHMAVLAAGWRDVLDWKPDLILVSAGFDAYKDDPITQMTLRQEDFAELGRWLHDVPCSTAAILEGGYSTDLPQLTEAFLAAWEGA